MKIDFEQLVAGLLFETFMKRYRFIDWTYSQEPDDIIEIKFRLWKQK